MSTSNFPLKLSYSYWMNQFSQVFYIVRHCSQEMSDELIDTYFKSKGDKVMFKLLGVCLTTYMVAISEISILRKTTG